MLTQKLFHPIVHQLMIKTCIFNGFTNRSNLTLYLFFSGNTDIHNGNLKLILALLWSLIANYQLGASNFPPKKLMLEWLKVSTTGTMAIHVVEFSNGGYKIRKIFAYESTYPKKIIEF